MYGGVVVGLLLGYFCVRYMMQKNKEKEYKNFKS